MLAVRECANEVCRLALPHPLSLGSYCTDLAVGSKVGSKLDGTVLWKMGDGGTIQQVYVAYSPSLGIVVSYEGKCYTLLRRLPSYRLFPRHKQDLIRKFIR